MNRHGLLGSAVVTLMLAVSLLAAPTPASASAPPVASTGSGGASTQSSAAPARLAPNELKVMNYYPANAGWSAMWANYSHTRTDADFAAIAALGANTVRIIVQPEAVGWPAVTPAGAGKLLDIVTVAARHGLGVEISLFDLWFSWADLADSRWWAAHLLSPYRGDPRIALVELRNEIPPNADAMNWAAAMLPYLATLLPGVPRSLSTNNSTTLRVIAGAIPVTSLDVIDIHLYGRVEMMPARLAVARAVAGARPVIVGEAGASTGGWPPGDGAEQAQLTFYQQVAQLVADAGLRTFAPWILSDFTPTGMPAYLTNPVGAAMGLRRQDGTWKPATQVVRDMFHHTGHFRFAPGQLAATKINADNGFEHENSTAAGGGRLGSWRTATPHLAGVVTAGRSPATNTRLAAVIGRKGGNRTSSPALYQTFLLLSGSRTVSVSAQALPVRSAGSSRIAIAWFDGNHYLGSAQAPHAGRIRPGWRQNTMTATAPGGATSFQIHLKSADDSGITFFDSIDLS